MKTVVLIAVFLFSSRLLAQDSETAKQVYKSAEPSVFLIYMNGEDGKSIAQGTAFLVASRTLVTNAHVVAEGKPVLAIGPVQIPVRVLRRDEQNDLALLAVDVDLTSRPLQLASGEQSPGEQVFALGNPEGLEKSISQGIVSGQRSVGGRGLIQITAPISHGSSGGPVLNAKGQVVGVAVGMLEDGQNLNFAVPASYVGALMNEKGSPSVVSAAESLDSARSYLERRSKSEYSADESSEYQDLTRKLLAALDTTVTDASDPNILHQTACMGTKAFDTSGAGVRAARKLVAASPSADSHEVLAYSLLDRMNDEAFVSAVAKDGTPDQAAAQSEVKVLATEAEVEAERAISLSKAKKFGAAGFVLAAAKQQLGESETAVALYAPLASQSLFACGSDLREQVFRSLISLTAAMKLPDDAEKWFRRFAATFNPSPFDWDLEGDRRSDANDNALAADAHERAASADDAYGYDYCYASVERYREKQTDEDGVLRDGRLCVEASTKKSSGATADGYFKAQLPIVYRFMADVLNTRGSYEQALEYIKESLALLPDSSMALFTEAEILTNLQRNSECISAAQAAIRYSDGKFPWMNFRLGYCYFQTEDWRRAASAFQISATADKTDATSAYDLALSLSRQGFTADAKEWFREALKRNPDPGMKQKILDSLRE